MNNNFDPSDDSKHRASESLATALHEPLDDSPSLSKKDKQLKSTLYLKEMSERLVDVRTELIESHRAFSKIERLTRNEKKKLTALKRTIIPFLEESSMHIRSASKTIAPIGGLEYVHNRDETDRKQIAQLDKTSSDKNSIKSIALLRLEHASYSRTPLRPIVNTVRPDPVPHRLKKKRKCNLPTIMSSVRPPLDNIQYKPMEVICILSRIPKGSSNRCNLIKYFVKENLVPIKMDGIYRLLRRYEEGKLIKEDWNLPGRHRLLSTNDIANIQFDLNKFSGSTLQTTEIGEKIRIIQKEKVIAQGRVPITKEDITPCMGTLINYQAAIANQDNVSICTSVVPKTRTRYSAENSLISAMALLCVIAAIHYDVCTEIQPEHENIMNKVPLDVPPGAQLMYRMVAKAYGKDVPIIPVRPEMILSTDDTVQYIFEGKGQKKDLFRLVASKAFKKAGTRSKFKNDDSKNMCGMRVKLTYTFSGAGTMAPIFITVLGLNDRELPKDHCVSLKIRGLCVGGGGVTVGSKGYGIMMFMRGEKGIDKERYKIYRDEVLIPFIKESRHEFGGWVEGTPIPEDMKAVSWCDGDLAQIENIISNESMQVYVENMVCAAKQNAARSGTEQFADLTKCFKQMQALQKLYTVSDVPLDRHPMKRMIDNQLKNLQDEGKLVLKPTKKNSLIDFIASVPAMTSKAITRDNIIHGVVENGMLDKNFFRYPDMNKILATCRRDPTNAEYKLCVDSFPMLLKKYLEHGHVNDEVFEKLGFPMDTDVDGTKVRLTSRFFVSFLLWYILSRGLIVIHIISSQIIPFILIIFIFRFAAQAQSVSKPDNVPKFLHIHTKLDYDKRGLT